MSHKLIQDALTNALPSLLAKELTSSLRGAEVSKYGERIKKLFDHTMSGGKYARSRLALDTYTALQPNASQTELVSAAKVAASIELMQTFYLIIDDIMDEARIRRGKPCWHTLPGIGLNAINDGLVLDCAIDLVIREAIPQHPHKLSIIQTLYETKRKTVIGQMLDSDSVDLSEFSWERYGQIVEHKTSHYTYYCPITLGCYLADNIAYLHEAQSFAYKIGSLFQAQDDFLDVFGDESITGKTGTDISERKCSWVICRTLDKIRNDPVKLKEFTENFGKSDKSNVQVVKQIARDVGVEEDFKHLQKNLAQQLYHDADSFVIRELRRVFHAAVDDLYDRKK